MEDATETRYWCHMCSRLVDPVTEGEVISCNFCQGGFVEQMDDAQDSVTNDHHQAADSLWAPILMEMMNNHDQHSTNQRPSDDDDDDGELDLPQQLEEIMRIRARHSAAIVDMLQGIRAGLLIEPQNNQENPDHSELVIMINSFNQSIRVHQDSIDTTSVPSGSLGDYLTGPGFHMLLQRLAETDLNNRYGTPPAQKQSVEALPLVTINECLQCCVCLDDFEIGMEAKEMPCYHKFHTHCLLPWLELHSSCPVCRFLLPSADDDDTKTDAETLTNDDLAVASMQSDGSSPDSSSNHSPAN